VLLPASTAVFVEIDLKGFVGEPALRMVQKEVSCKVIPRLILALFVDWRDWFLCSVSEVVGYMRKLFKKCWSLKGYIRE
jgi:hypothetical protein